MPHELRDIYRTAWEVPMRALIDLAADRGAYIDQSQSLNLFLASPSIGKGGTPASGALPQMPALFG